MKRNHDDEYRISAADFESFMRRAGENDDQPADADIDPPIEAENQAEIPGLLALLDDPVELHQEAAAPVAAPPVDDHGLTDDEKAEAIAALEDGCTPPSIPNYVAPAPPSKFDDALEVIDPEALAALRKRSEMLSGYLSRREISKKQNKDNWDKVFDEARARIHAVERKAKTVARAARAVVSKRAKRADYTDRRIAALEKATANHGGDRFMVKLTGEERGLAVFRNAVDLAHERHGPTASLTEIAAVWSAMTGTRKSKQQAGRKRDIVKKLEAKGRPWYRWRES